MSEENNETTIAHDPTNVSVETVIELCRELGCSVQRLKSFWAIEAPTYNKKALYVGIAKKRLTRLDVAGFTPEEHPTLCIYDGQWAKDMKLGAVRAQILPKELREGDVLEGVRACVRGLLSEEEGFKLGKRKVKSEDTGSKEGEEHPDADSSQELAA